MLLVALTAAVAVLSKAGRVGKSAYAAIGVMTLILAGVAVILGVMKHFEVDASEYSKTRSLSCACETVAHSVMLFLTDFCS